MMELEEEKEYGYLVIPPPGSPDEMEVWPTDPEALESAAELHNKARAKGGGGYDGRYSLHRVVMKGNWGEK